MKYSIISVLLCAAIGYSFRTWSQNETDILRYSQHEISGTLRNIGMGGTTGAIGADLSCGFSNPAGLGLYRRGDLAMTVGFAGMSTGLAYEGLNQRGTTSNAPITNAGLAITYPSIDPDWPFVTFAIAYQKRTELHQQILAEGAPLNGSLLDLFLAQSQGLYVNELYSSHAFTSALAWETYLLDPDPSNPACETCYVSALSNVSNVVAAKRIDRTGTQGETAISLATNFRHRLYFGGTVGLPTVTFSEQIQHDEYPIQDSAAVMGWSYEENLDLEGNGVNLRLGMIWAAADWMRIGINYATRSRLSLKDNYSTRISSHWNDGTALEASSALNQFEYTIYTPSRFAIQSVFVMGKSGLVTAEYERTDYRQGELRAAAFSGPTAYDFAFENEIATLNHTVSHAARVGAEIRIGRDYRIRLGAGMTPSPYSEAAEVVTDATRYTGSFGWAYRGETWYAGFSYAMTVWEEDLYIWGLPNDVPATLQRQNGIFALGIGARI